MEQKEKKVEAEELQHQKRKHREYKESPNTEDHQMMEEWHKVTANLRRLLFFWQRRQQQTGTDESLTSLLAKRDEARQSFERNKPSAPDPRLFQSEQMPTEVANQPSATAVAEAGPVDDPHATEDDSTTSRLLAAKRRAFRRKK